MGKGSKGERMAATPQQQQVLQQQQRQLRAMKLQGQQAQRSGAVSTAGRRQQRKRPGAIKLGAPQDRPPWYLCGMPRPAVKQIAVRMKQQGGVGAFLIRDVSSLPGGMALCIKLPTGKLGNYVIENVQTDRHPTGVGFRIKGSKQMFPSLNELVTYYMEMPRPPFDFVWSVALLGGGNTINTSYTSHNMRSPTSQQRGPRSPRSPQTPWMSPTSQQNTSHRTHNVAHNSHYSRGGVGEAGAMPSVFRGRRGDFEYQSEQARVSKQKAARTQAKLHIERERVKQLESQLRQERARAAQERARNDTREVQALQSEVRNLKSTVTGVDAQLAQKIQMMEQRLQSERDVVTNLTVQLREDITSAKAMRDAARKTSDRRQNAGGVSSPSSPAPQSPGVFSEGGGAAEHERAVVEDLRAQLLAEKNRVRQLLSASKADRRRSSVEVDAQLAAAAAEQADAEGAAQRSKQTEEAKMRSSGLATWAMFPSLHGVAPPDFSMTETGAERAARYLANREGVVPEDTLVLEGPVKGSAAAAVAAAAGAASQTGSKSAFSYTSRQPLTVEQTIENARREAFRVKKLYDASRDGSAGRAGGAGVDVEFGFDNYENVDLQSKPRRSGGDRTSSGSGDEDRGQRMLDEHREVYGKWGDDNLQAAAMRAARDGPMRRLGKSSPPKTPQESMLEYQLRQTRLNASQQLNNSMVAAAAPQDATDWSTRVQQLVAGIDAAPSAYAAVEPLPATSGNGKHAETRHFQRIRAVMEQSRHHTEAAIKDGLLQDLDREEERLLDAIQQKTTLVGSLETQSKHVSAFLQSAQGTLGDLDLQDRTAALNIVALEEALVKLGEEKDAVETELATTDVELAKVHGEKAYAKGSYEGWDAKLKTREHERRALDTALETQRQKQVMLSSDEARARAELAEEEDRMVELLSEEAQIEAILTSKEVEMAAKLANSRMAANQRNAAKQEAARRAIEEQRLLGAHEAGSGKGMMVAGGGAAPSQAQLQELLSSSIIGIDEALLDMNFGISDDMRLAAAEHHVTTLEAAYQKAQHQLVLAEDAAKLSGEYPAAMAALAAERAADEDAGRATLVSFRRDSATAQFEAGKAVYGSILDQPFANVGVDAKAAAATPVVAEENVTGFSDGSVSSWSSDAGTIVQPTSLQTSNASSIFANAALANISPQHLDREGTGARRRVSHIAEQWEGAGATNQAPAGKDASLGSAGGRRSPRGEGSAGGSGRTSRARPMSRASTGGWDSESNFGFDSDDSVDYADEAGGGTTLFANVKGAWDFRSKVAASPEKESDRFIHRRLSSALLNANTN